MRLFAAPTFSRGEVSFPATLRVRGRLLLTGCAALWCETPRAKPMT
jgi:hypothetical protein